MDEESKIGQERLKQIIKQAFHEETDIKPVPAPHSKQPTDWKDLQIKVKEIYENLGCRAEEEVKIKGAKEQNIKSMFLPFLFCLDKTIGQ